MGTLPFSCQLSVVSYQFFEISERGGGLWVVGVGTEEVARQEWAEADDAAGEQAKCSDDNGNGHRDDKGDERVAMCLQPGS